MDQDTIPGIGFAVELHANGDYLTLHEIAGKLCEGKPFFRKRILHVDVLSGKT